LVKRNIVTRKAAWLLQRKRRQRLESLCAKLLQKSTQRNKERLNGEQMVKRGLYANIHAKRKRIATGSGERMRKAGAKGAPTAKAFKQSAKTAKKK
jgi:hypothetical protein